jgi:hypothetical protein
LHAPEIADTVIKNDKGHGVRLADHSVRSQKAMKSGKLRKGESAAEHGFAVNFSHK